MSTDLVTTDDPAAAVTLFGTDNPAEVINRATTIATTLADLVRKQDLIVRIGSSDHVRVEGWTLLGSMLGVFPVVIWTRPMLKDDQPYGWEARVEARTRTGEVVGAAEAECLRSEPPWSFDPPPNKWGKKPPARDDYALRSMAQTRAVSKALRMPLGFVMQLAGFNPTPAEEMPVLEHKASVGEPRAGSSAPTAGTVAGGDHPPVPQAGEDEPASPTEHIHAAAQVARVDQPPVDMADPDIPFGDGAQHEHQPHNPASVKQKKKLDVLVKGGKEPPALRRVYATVARMRKIGTANLIEYVDGTDQDGTLHWSPLRDSLSFGEAHELIDRLERVES